MTALREVRDSEPKGEMIVASACDPVNLPGIVTPGDRVPAVLGNRVLFRDGAPLAALVKGEIVPLAPADVPTMERARALLAGRTSAVLANVG